MTIFRLQRMSGIFILVLVCCMVTSLSSWAQQKPSRVSINTFAAKKMTIVNGKSLILESETPIKRISVAAPAIADAMALTPWQIYVTGKSPGVTNLSLWDEKGKELIEVFDVQVVPDTARLKEKIYEMYEGEDVNITADHNAITLTGSVSSTVVMDQILALARSYAPKGEGGGQINNFLEVGGVHQVMLEVRVSEMARSTMKKIGFNWNYVSDGGSTFGISVLDNLTSVTVSGSSIATTLTDPINMIFRFGGLNATWTTFIDALKENGLTKVLAEPTLITLSGKQANFLAGGEFPIPVPAGDGDITIDYKTYGVGLNFTPTVLNNGQISMEVAPEVSDLDYTNAVSYQGFVVPGITVRRVSTVIELADGQSFAIAGLLKDNVSETVRKFPLLGDIPILGALFRSSNFQKKETELVVIVTPHLVRPVDMSKQTLPTDQFIEPDDFEFYLLGKLEGAGDGEPLQETLKDGGLEGNFGHILY